MQENLDWFKSYGFLLFRGFEVDSKKMKAFAEQFSSRFIRDRGRPLVDSSDGFVSLVDGGTHYISPHCEHANSPFRPDVVWFCCAVPVAQGGETLVWDGVQVWQEMSEELRKLFLDKKIRFFQKFPAAAWKYFLGTGSTIVDVKKTLDSLEGVSYQINPDQSVSLEYVCSAVVKTRYHNHDAFANSLISEYKNPRGVVTFEDGSPIPEAAINEIKEIMNRLTEVISWQFGDLAMIDNTRFLHGRRAFKDTKRRILSLLSYLK
ncbi:MAG: TauD/TfdA family dioxygenase [Cyanobacteria bacterium P01_A01_bin.37]